MITLPQSIEGFPRDIQNLFEAIVEARSFQRLANVNFLGAIDRLASSASQKDSGSRLEHSVGVADLVLSFADKVELTPGELRVAVVNGLLHDIGHGPFSHSSEPFFSSVFQVDHHRTLLSMIEDDASEISKILKSFGLWRDYRKFVRSPGSIPAVNDLFFGPINLDTIEGIVRSAIFFDIDTDLNCTSLANSISRRRVRIRPLDEFWELKSNVYNNYIFGDEYAQHDEVLTLALHSLSDRIRPEHFLLDDFEFEDVLGSGFRSALELHSEQLGNALRRRRKFQINRTATPRQFGGLNGRYAEIKGGGGDEWFQMRRSSRKAESSLFRR